jgi:hypothetical protein
MTWVFSTTGNIFTPRAAPGCTTLVYTLVKFLASLSGSPWTIPQWSNGSSVATDNGASLTSATQIDNSLAWVRIAIPGGGKEFTFQHSSTATSSGGDSIWRVKYCPTGSFNTGSSATATPSATVQGILAGGGTDASPTFPSAGFGYPSGLGNTSHRFFIGADNASPSGWYAASVSISGGTIYPMNMWFFDPLVSGSYPSEETDPYVVSTGWDSSNLNINYFATSFYRDDWSFVRGFLGTLTSSNFTGIQSPIPTINTTQAIPSGLGTNQFSYKDNLFRLIWMRRSGLASPTGYKGMSSIFSYNGVLRATMDTLTVSTSRDRILIGNTWLPWDGSIPIFV